MRKYPSGSSLEFGFFVPAILLYFTIFQSSHEIRGGLRLTLLTVLSSKISPLAEIC